MKRLTGLLATTLVLPLAFTITACGGDEGNDGGGDTDASDDDDDDDESGGTPAGCADPNDTAAPVQTISGTLDGGADWSCESIYLLDGPVFVNGGTLSIGAGTTIKGTAGSALVVDTDATIDVQGTEDAPVVMTSALPEGERNRGDWGGLILIGLAPNNLEGGVGAAEGFATPPEYGGSDEAHSCGNLSYLRVEWAGFELSAGNELNGVTFYSCGTGTRVDHLQVHMGQDDGIEMFGGNFDSKYVVVTGAADDSLDCDEGFRGRIQHMFLQQDPTVGDNCFEWSNQGADFTATPLTGPTVANVTCVGSGDGGEKSKGMTLKEGTEAGIYSSIFTGLTNEGVLLTHQETQNVAESGGIAMAGNIFSGHAGFAVGEGEEGTMWSAADLQTWLLDAGNMDGVDPGLPSVTWGSPNIAPAADSAAASSGATPSDSFFDATSYSGAVEPGTSDDWTQAGWINYTP